MTLGWVVGFLGLACLPGCGFPNLPPLGDDGGVGASRDALDARETIIDATARIDGTAGPDEDGGIDAATGDYLQISLADVRIARQQFVRFHVQRIRSAGGADDVTEQATYSADSAVVELGEKGTVTGVEAGNAIITASLDGARSATVPVTVSAVLCHPVINEFATGTVVSADDEFVELYHPCVTVIDVSNWTLVYRAPSAIGAADTHPLIVLSGQMLPGDLRLYGGAAYPGPALAFWPSGFGMAQRSGAIGLRSGPIDTGLLVDAVAYGDVTAGHPFIEANAMAAMANGTSAARLPFDGNDGTAGVVDGDNAADFTVVATPTPGARNVP